MNGQLQKQEQLPEQMTLERIIEDRQKMVLAIEDIQAGLSVLNEELLKRLDEQKVNGMIVGDKTISKVKRVSFSTPLEEARELGATKTEEKIDEKKLKTLYNSGASISGVRVTEYVMVKDMQTKAEETAA